MEIQKIPNSQSNLEKKNKTKLEDSGFLTSDHTTKLRSSEKCGTVTKIVIEISGTAQKAQKYIHTHRVN